MTILELTIDTLANSQTLINRWNYYLTGGSTPLVPTASNALITALGYRSWVPGDGEYGLNGGINFANALRSSLPANYRVIAITAKDVYNIFDFDTYLPEPDVEGVGPRGVSDAEALTNNPAVVWQTVGYVTNRTRQDIRAGQKRLSGLVERDFVSFGRLTTEYLEGIARPLAARMSDVLELGGGWLAIPCVVSKERYDVLDRAGNPTGRTATRYYSDVATQIARTMYPVVWSPKPFTRSQTSRQTGRGR